MISYPEFTVDVILRTTDNQEIHTSKVLLALASEFFRDMFSLPQPNADEAQEFIDGKLVLPVDQHSSAWRLILS
jgi:hypothetical protein